jgi:hypothetical protein
MPLATTKVTAYHRHQGEAAANVESTVACFIRAEPPLLDEREKERRKPARPGRRGNRVDSIDRDHTGSIKPNAFGGMAKPGLGNQK